MSATKSRMSRDELVAAFSNQVAELFIAVPHPGEFTVACIQLRIGDVALGALWFHRPTEKDVWKWVKPKHPAVQKIAKDSQAPRTRLEWRMDYPDGELEQQAYAEFWQDLIDAIPDRVLKEYAPAAS